MERIGRGGSNKRNGAAESTPATRARRRAATRTNGNGADPRLGGGANGGPPRDDRPELAVIDGDGEPAAARPKLKKLRALLVFAGLGLLALVSWVFGIMMALAQDLPSLENRAQYERAENSVMVDITGQRLGTVTNNEGRILVSSEDIAPAMKNAVVAIEDERFYDHRGVDYQAIVRALYQDVLAGAAEQGGSTITQQFVKNALEAQNSRTVLQKLREAALAYHLERQWSKDKILTEYLNSIYFGEGAYGIEAAAQTYFGWNHAGCAEEASCASQLLPWEAALLAGVISSPAAGSPRANPEAAELRRNLVLQKMAELGFISGEEYASYVEEPLPPASAIEPPADDSVSPYFTSWVRQQLVDRYGAGEAFGGGLEVKTTLDLALQQQVEAAAHARTAGVGLDTAIVVLDNETAGVRAMVGGFDYEKSPFNLATNGQRQPGSAFKPFTLVTALEQGHSTSQVFSSAPKEFPFQVKVKKRNGKTQVLPDVFEVNNYDDSYLGSASLATATQYSDNSVFAELGLTVGLGEIAETARKLGVRSDLRSEERYAVNGGSFEPYNPALTLGGLSTGVTPLEMAHAFETLEEDGNRVSGTMAASPGGPVGIAEVRDDDGDPVEDKTGASGINETVRRQVVDPAVAQTATETLELVVTGGTGQRAAVDDGIWGKTGTTDDNGDAWFVGANEDVTAAVWVGHAESTKPMLTEFGGGPVDGGTIPTLLFADVVNAWESLEASRTPVSEEVEEPLAEG